MDTQVLHVISGPVVGALIGYITNYIAVRMLFRPAKPVYIGRLRVPFTPGVVPRRKDELADLLGHTIAKKFWGAEELTEVFTSEAVADAVAEFMVGRIPGDEDGIRAAVRKMRGEKQVSKLSVFKEELLVQAVLENFDSWNSRYGGQSPHAQHDPQNENDMHTSGTLISRIKAIYLLQMKGGGARRIADAIDVGGLIARKIRAMDAVDVEAIVLEVVRRELRYVILLGAALGAVIGTVGVFM